jgi:hypothetical protein
MRSEPGSGSPCELRSDPWPTGKAGAAPRCMAVLGTGVSGCNSSSKKSCGGSGGGSASTAPESASTSSSAASGASVKVGFIYSRTGAQAAVVGRGKDVIVCVGPAASMTAAASMDTPWR